MHHPLRSSVTPCGDAASMPTPNILGRTIWLRGTQPRRYRMALHHRRGDGAGIYRHRPVPGWQRLLGPLCCSAIASWRWAPPSTLHPTVGVVIGRRRAASVVTIQRAQAFVSARQNGFEWTIRPVSRNARIEPLVVEDLVACGCRSTMRARLRRGGWRPH